VTDRPTDRQSNRQIKLLDR